jgi:predicted  nucleic acid-binding Zn-ribbon protein
MATSNQSMTVKAAKKRWTAGRKKEAVLRLIKGEYVDTLSRKLGIEIGQLESWKETLLEGMELILKDRSEEPLAIELEAAKKQIGELHMENELLRSKVAKKGVFYSGKW